MNTIKKAFAAVWKEVTEGRAIVVAVVVSVAVTIIALLQSYDGFLGTALGTSSFWLLAALNALFTVLLFVILSAIVKPQRKAVYAAIVALSFQVLIATDLEVQPLAGTTEVGASSKINLGKLYDPVEKALSSGIEDPIEDAKRAQIDVLRKEYSTPEKLPVIRERLDDLISTEGSLDTGQREALLKRIDEIIALPDRPVRYSVRDILLAVYASAGRDMVDDLVAASKSSA